MCVCGSSCSGSMQRCIVSSMHSSIHRFKRCLDSFFDSSMYQMRPMFYFGYPLPVFVNLLCSCFVNLGVGFGVILSVSGSILMLFWCAWESFGDPVPSRGPPKEAESKMATKRWFVGPPLDPPRAPKINKLRRNLKVRLCVGVGMLFLRPRCRQVGLDMLKAQQIQWF